MSHRKRRAALIDVASELRRLETAIHDLPALTVVGAVALLFLKPLVERWLRGWTCWRAIKQEVADVARHLARNGARIDEMRKMAAGGAELPVRVHVQKLAIAERSLLFSDKALEDLPARGIASVHRARARCRNFNIDVQEALRVLDLDDRPLFEVLLAYLAKINGRLRRWAPGMLSEDDVGGTPVPIIGRPAPDVDRLPPCAGSDGAVAPAITDRAIMTDPGA